MPADDRVVLLAFVPEHASSGHRVLGLRDRGDGAEADTVASVPDAPSVRPCGSGVASFGPTGRAGGRLASAGGRGERAGLVDGS